MNDTAVALTEDNDTGFCITDLIDDYQEDLKLFEVRFAKVMKDDGGTLYYHNVILEEQPNHFFKFKGTEIKYVDIKTGEMSIKDFQNELTDDASKLLSLSYYAGIYDVENNSYIENKENLMIEYCTYQKPHWFRYFLSEVFGYGTAKMYQKAVWYMQSGRYLTGGYEEVEMLLTEEQMEDVIDMKTKPINLISVVDVVNK